MDKCFNNIMERYLIRGDSASIAQDSTLLLLSEALQDRVLERAYGIATLPGIGALLPTRLIRLRLSKKLLWQPTASTVTKNS